jgi:quercetin dioxygenase-like cupin family protein
MFVIDEKEKEYRFGDNGPKYLMQGPRMNFAVVQFTPGKDFRAHYHEVMEENFYVLEGSVDIYVDDVKHTLTKGQFIHIEPGETHYLVNTSAAPVKLTATLAPFTDGDKIEVENPQVK